PIALNVDTVGVSWRQTIKVNWASVPGNVANSAWVGLFARGVDDVDERTGVSLSGGGYAADCRQPICGGLSEGTCFWTIDPTNYVREDTVGEFEFRLFNSSDRRNRQRLATSSPFKISRGGSPLVPTNATLRVDRDNLSC